MRIMCFFFFSIAIQKENIDVKTVKSVGGRPAYNRSNSMELRPLIKQSLQTKSSVLIIQHPKT